jgi:hypothetical protein
MPIFWRQLPSLLPTQLPLPAPRFISFPPSLVIIMRVNTFVIHPPLILHGGDLRPSSPMPQSMGTDIPSLSATVLTWLPFKLPILWPMFVPSWRFPLHYFSVATASFCPPTIWPLQLTKPLFHLMLPGPHCLPHVPLSPPLSSPVHLGYQGGLILHW